MHIEWNRRLICLNMFIELLQKEGVIVRNRVESPSKQNLIKD